MNLEKRGQVNNGLIIVGVVVALIVIGAIIFFVLRPSGEEEFKLESFVEECAYFCETNQKSGFCSFRVTVNENLRTTCNELATNSQYSQYGVQPCATISCTTQGSGTSGTPSDDQTCAGLGGTWENPTTEGSCPTKEGFFVRKRTAEDSPPVEGQVCCYYYE